METTEIETETVPSIQLPCTSCTRTFRPEALAKHSKVCEKTLMKKRKQFDSSKQRLQGTEIENFVQTVPKTSRKKEAQLNLSKSKWKEKVEQARAIHAAKKPTETPLSSQVIKPSDHEECPYCGRSFGPKAYERHTEFCKEQLQKLKVSNNCNSEARERLKVRTTYRGPLTNKVLNRDRYQPNRNRDPSPLRMSSSSEIFVTDESPKSRGLSRHSSLRSSLRSKPETTPPPPLRRTMTQINPPSKGARGSPKDNNETDLQQKTQMFNNKPRMISKEPIEKRTSCNWGTHRMKPTSIKAIAQSSLKAAGSQPKSPPKLNNTDVNIFKGLSVISCFPSGSSEPDNNLKLINNHHSSIAVPGTIISNDSLKYVLKNSNAACIEPIYDHHSPVVKKIIKSETPFNAISKSEIITDDVYFKPVNDQPQSIMATRDLHKAVGGNLYTSINDHQIQETINCKMHLNAVPQNGIVKSDLQKDGDQFKPTNDHSQTVFQPFPRCKMVKPDLSKAVNYHYTSINDHHPLEKQETIIWKMENGSVKSDLQKDGDQLKTTNNQSQTGNNETGSLNSDVHFKLSNYGLSSALVEDAIKYESSLDVPQSETEVSNADHCFKPINDNPSVEVQETIELDTSSNAMTKSEIKVISCKEDLNLENCSLYPINDRKVNLTSRDCEPLKEEINTETYHTESNNRNLAFTIEFKPDNIFSVHEQHKVGIKKSPFIFKKRVSKSYESIKSFNNKESDFECLKIQSSASSTPEEPLTKENSLAISKDELNITPNHEVKATETDDLLLSNSSNKGSLSWRERVLEIMEVSDIQSNKNLNILPNKNYNQIDLCPLNYGLKNIESQSENVNNSKDKFTDTDNSLLVNQELIDILSPKKKSLENFTDAILDNDEILNEKNTKKPVPNSEETIIINEKNVQNVSKNYFLGADLYFSVENNNETGKVETDESLEVDKYFVEEKNITNEVLRKEISDIENDGLEVERYFYEENNITNEVFREEISNIENDDSLEADRYFVEEKNINDEVFREEISNIGNDDSLEAARYFVEENNITNEVFKEEISNIEGIVEDRQSVRDSNEPNLFIDNQNVGTVVDTDNIDAVEDNLDGKDFNDNSRYMNDGYQGYEVSGGINIVISGDIELNSPFVNESGLNSLVDLEDCVINDQTDIFNKENYMFENVASSASPVSNTHKLEKTIGYRSLSDSELLKNHFKPNEISKIVKKSLDTTYEIEEDALNFQKPEGVDSLTLVKDDILRIAGQEFVLIANRNKEFNTLDGIQINHNCNIDFEKINVSPQMTPGNNQYHGSYKPNTYCCNTHINGFKYSDEMSSDIFSNLKRSNEEWPKMNAWKTLHHGSDCSADYESLSELDSLDVKSREDSCDELYIFLPDPVYGGSVPFEIKTFNHPVEDFSAEAARYFSSSSSNVTCGEEQRSLNESAIVSEKPLSPDPPLTLSSKTHSYGGSASSRIPLLNSRRNDAFRSNTLPPLFNESTTTNAKCGKQNNKKKPESTKNFINDYDTNSSSINNSSEESDCDWDLSDNETFERKKTVFNRSSKTVYNKYYEQVEYSKESNEFQTIKTTVSNLPLPHADFFKEKEFKLPKIQSKHAPIDKKVHKKKMMDFEKLPLLRNLGSCKWCFPQVVRHVITTVLPKRFSIEDAEKYNPYLSAERQMLELFGSDDVKGKTSLPEIHNSSPIQSSPISAFVKYSSPKRALSIESLKSDNKENNNVNPDVIDFPPVGDKIDNRKNFSLSNLSLCSVVSIDSIDCNKNSFNSKLSDSHLDDFQRSFSAFESKSNRAVVKPKVNLQQMLYGSHTISPEETGQREGNSSDTDNLEACEAELLISMLEFEKMLKSSPPSSPETSPNLCSSSSKKEKESDDDVENRNHKFLNNSIDSAYSSLTRSSGAEGDTGKAEMSKFCHECGTKYPIAGAKFCCNCGMRRITL